MRLMSDGTYKAFAYLFSDLPREKIDLLDHMQNEILSNLSHYSRIADFRKPGEKVEAIFLDKAAHYSQEEQIILKRSLLAKLALHLPVLVEQMSLPASILALYPTAFERLAYFLEKQATIMPYDAKTEFFSKDVRFVLSLSIPCGARIVDMNSCITLPSVIVSAFRSRRIEGIIRYFLAGGLGTWLRGHIDSRYLSEFNEQGNNNHYFRVGELLEQRKDLKGLVITSWYYDPHVLKLSPRLTYLREHPREGGAFFLRHGADQMDIENAIKRSETRRRLYYEGKYNPVCYSMIWPRNQLLAWKKRGRLIVSD